MNILNSVKDLQSQLSRKTSDADRKREVSEQGLTDEGAFPNFAKFVLFGALAALNVRLFVVTVGGVWGAVVASAAVMSACFAVYCWNRVDKSKGAHLRVMQIGAAGFTGIELLHATASVWELTAGLDGETKAWAFWYSHKVAFPLMALSILLGYAAHRYTFWTAEINKARAQSEITIAVERASLDTQKARLEMERELAHANLEHLRQMGQIEAETQRQIGLLTSAQPATFAPVSKPLTAIAAGQKLNGATHWDEASVGKP